MAKANACIAACPSRIKKMLERISQCARHPIRRWVGPRKYLEIESIANNFQYRATNRNTPYEESTQHLRALAAAQGLASPAVLRCNGGYELADCVHVGRRRIGYHDAPQQIFLKLRPLRL